MSPMTFLLLSACNTGDAASVKELLKHSYDSQTLNAALRAACATNQVDVVAVLMNDTQLLTTRQNQALTVACASNSVDVFNFLVDTLKISVNNTLAFSAALDHPSQTIAKMMVIDYGLEEWVIDMYVGEHPDIKVWQKSGEEKKQLSLATAEGKMPTVIKL